jgi:hypothetical protein
MVNEAWCGYVHADGKCDPTGVAVTRARNEGIALAFSTLRRDRE